MIPVDGHPGDSPGRTDDRGAPFFLHIALFFLLVCINALVARFVVFTFGIAPGSSSVYLVVALMVVFTLWFGMYGAVAAYAGCFIGAGVLGGIPPIINLVWSLADFWQVLIPLIAFRYFDADPALKSWRDLGILAVFGIFLNNIAGAAWGSLTLATGGIIPWSGTVPVFFGWLAGNIIVSIVLIPAILFLLTPVIQDHDLYAGRTGK
jgi:hypothetical protein